MKPFLISLLFASIVINGASAQSPIYSWALCDSTDYTLNPTLVDYDVRTNGNRILQTGFETVVTVYATHAMGDVMLRLTDLSGNIIQEEILPGKGRVISLDALENRWVFILEFIDNLEVLGTHYTHPTGQGKGQLVMVLDNNLNLEWISHLTISDPNIQARDVASDKQGGFWLSLLDGFDHRLLHYDSAYARIDSLTIQDAGWFSEILPTDDGRLYLAGSCAGPYMEFPDTVVTNSLSYNSYVALLNEDAELQWIEFFHDVTCSSPNLALAPDGGVYFAITIWDSLTAGNFFVNGPSWVSDFMLLRIDTSGTILWAKETPEILARVELSLGNYLDSDEFGNVYIAGASRGTIDWGNGVVTTGQNTTVQLWILSLDPMGNARWTKSNGSGYVNLIHSIAVNNPDEIAMTGNVGDSSYFGNQMLNCDPNFNPFLAMLSAPTGSVDYEIPVAEIDIYPNPADNMVNVKAGEEIQLIRLFDVNGRIIQNEEVKSIRNANLTIDATPPGIYVIQVVLTSGIVVNRKLIVR